MANAFTLFGEIKVNTSGFDRSLHDAEVRLSRTERAIGDTERKAASLGKTNAVTARSYEKLNESVKMNRERMREAVKAFENGQISQSRLSAVMRQTDTRVNSLNSRLADMNARLRDTRTPMRDAITGLGEFAAVAGSALGAAVIAVGTYAVRTAVSMDSLKRGLTAVTGSAEEAERQLVRLKEIAKLPGLGFQDAIRGSINLQAAGLSANTAERALMAFGNALAIVGKGKADLDGVSLALTQIANKSRVSAQEINQLSERVPQIREAMKAAFGTADTEELEKKGIKPAQFIEGIITALEKLPKATTSAQGSFENFSDAVQRAVLPIGDAILTKILPPLEKMTEELEKQSSDWKAVGRAWGEALGKGFNTSTSNFAGEYERFLRGFLQGLFKDIKIDGTGIQSSLNALLEKMQTTWADKLFFWPVTVQQAMQKVIEAFNGAADDLRTEAERMGDSIGVGLHSGIMRWIDPIGAAGRALGNAAAGAARDVLGIQSPSKVFFKIGKDVAQGFIDGLNSMKVLVGESIARMFDVSGMNLKGGKKNAPGVELLTSMLRELSQFKDVSRETEILAELTAKAYEKQDKRLTEMLIKAAKMVDAEKRKAAWLERQAELIEQLKNTELPTPQFAEGNITGQGSGDWLEKLVEDSEKLRESYNDLYPPPPMMAAWDNFWLRMNQELIKWKSSLPSLKQAIGENLIQSIYNIGDVFGNAVAQWDGTAKGFFKSLAQGFKQMIQQIIAELIRLMVVKAIMNLIGSLAGSAIGGAAGGTGSLAGHGAGVPAGMASGGFVSGKGTSTSDSIAAMLSNGEFVMSAKAVKNWGKGFFENLNSMSPQMAFAGGGYVGGSGSSTYYNNTTTSSPVFNINVQGGGTRNEQMATASMLKREVMAALEIERRRNK